MLTSNFRSDLQRSIHPITYSFVHTSPNYVMPFILAPIHPSLPPSLNPTAQPVRARKCNLPIPTTWRSVAALFLGLRVRIRPTALMSVSCECCVPSCREVCVCRADHSSRGILPSVVCLNVCSLDNEEVVAY